MWAEDNKDGRVWEGGGGEKEGTTEESSVQGLKKHCSNAMNATGAAGMMFCTMEMCVYCTWCFMLE